MKKLFTAPGGIIRRSLPLLLLLLFACTEAPQTRPAQVDTVRIDAGAQLVTVAGTYRSGCETIADIAEQIEGTTATITLLVVDDPDLTCEGSDVPFTTSIPTALDLGRQGRWTVTVNGVSAVVAVNADGEVVTTSGRFERGAAPVAELAVTVDDGVPAAVTVTVGGSLADDCTRVDAVDQARQGARFTLTVETVRDNTATCPDEAAAYAEEVTLNVAGLPAGEYSVTAGELTRTFRLAVDNVPPENSAACTFDEPDLPGFGNPADGYCLQYPPGFLPATPRPGLLLLEAREPGAQRVSLTIARRGPAGELGPNNLADRAVIDLPVPAVDIIRTTIDVGGTDAVVLDRIPGAVESRQAFLVVDGTAYVLSLLPVGDGDATAVESAALLWETVIRTLHFIEE